MGFGLTCKDGLRGKNAYVQLAELPYSVFFKTCQKGSQCGRLGTEVCIGTGVRGYAKIVGMSRSFLFSPGCEQAVRYEAVRTHKVRVH